LNVCHVITHMALCLADAAAPLSSSAIDARLAGGAVVAAAATLTATMYTFHITLHTTRKQIKTKTGHGGVSKSESTLKT
jgi:hypothetical protein